MRAKLLLIGHSYIVSGILMFGYLARLRGAEQR